MIQKEIEDLFKNVSLLQISTALLRLLFFGNVSEESADRARAWYFDNRDGKRKIKDDALEIVFNEMLDHNNHQIRQISSKPAGFSGMPLKKR